MGFIIFAGLFGLTITAGFVQFAVFRKQCFSFRTAAASGVIAILFVILAAVVAGYFIARVRIDDHYEVNSEFAAIVVVGPATVGALLGAVVGGLAARYTFTSR
jgi:ABC-type thiamin/hydroxymethylpyrimidine transport system permease subunit